MISASALLCALAVISAAPITPVRVWQDTLQLPTSIEGPANPNPPFDLFSYGRFNYPYPLRDALTDRRESAQWRTLNLENEYLRLTVLPDLGGHIYSCLDKRTGREMFYANTAIKKALIGYRGAWAAFGVEFNFPVSHNWMSMSPVDFATVQNPDGSGSIWVGNTDLVYGGQWRVELRLNPGRAVLEQHVDLSNTSRARHRYYWWSNGAVQVWDDSHIVYPTELMATHGFTRIERWPIDEKGRDLSVIRNQTDGPVSLFTYGTREPFVGVYHPHTQSGTVHVAAPSELPTHKFWSWGYDRDAAEWRTALSDDDSAYIELQAGLFRNQETYAFLEPQETVRFAEYWLPVRDLGGITRANVDAVLHMERTTPTHLRLALDVTRDLPDARVTIRGAEAAFDQHVSLSPRQTWRWEGNVTGQSAVQVEVLDPDGHPVISHTENRFDRVAAKSVTIGPQPAPQMGRGELEIDQTIERGQIDELEGRRLMAMTRYQRAIASRPESLSLLKAAGRLATTLGWADAPTPTSNQTIEWLQRARARDTTDFEVEYYLGCALASAGRFSEARRFLESAQRFRSTRLAASVELGRVLAQEGQPDRALEQFHTAASDSPRATVPQALEIALLRRLGRVDAARQRAGVVRALDPTSSFIRYELTRLGEPDRDLWTHLSADANRVLDLVDHYLSIAAWDDALDLLERDYPVGQASPEPGAVAPSQSPLVAYYRGYARAKTGGNPLRDFELARSLPTAYVFPSRRSSYRVLEEALKASPSDATALFLLGSLYLSSGLVQPAIDGWQRVRHDGARIPVLHRNLGLALLQASRYSEARTVLEEGVEVDKDNVEVYLALDAVLSAMDGSPHDRVAALGRYPAADSAKPASLIFKAALALAAAGETAAAERLFHDRFFPREEGGTNVRTVYAQVRLTSAQLAADQGRCGAARQILDSLSTAQPNVSFTAGGLSDVVAAPTLSLQAASIQAACGRMADARSRWERLARPLAGDGAPLTLAIADAARQRLGRTRTAVERGRLERALENATTTLESAGTSNPGLIEYARGVLFDELGRKTESREALQRVFVYPDRGLSHALARIALNDAKRAKGRP